MAPPVNRKAAERAKLAIFGESAGCPVGGQETTQLTIEAVKMHEFSSDSECSTPSSRSHSSASSVSSQQEEDVAPATAQLLSNADDLKKRHGDEEAKLTDWKVSVNSRTAETEAAATAAFAAAASPSAAAALSANTAVGAASGAALAQTNGDMKAFSKPKKSTLISL